MIDLEYIYTTYLNNFEPKEDGKKFKEEIIFFLGDLIKEIDYSKKHLDYKKTGEEKHYSKDIIKFEANINIYKQSFEGENIRIKLPQRVNELFSISASLLYYQFNISEKVIFDIFELINEYAFKLDGKKPSIKNAQQRQHNLIQLCKETSKKSIQRQIERIQEEKNLADDEVKECIKKLPNLYSFLNKE